MAFRKFFPALVSGLLLLAACRRDEAVTYRVPKEKYLEAKAAASGGGGPAPSGMAGTPVTTADGPALVWTAPAHWAKKPASAMRKGSYTVTSDGGATGDLSITAFPGNVGGELANVNRWRGQIQLPPIGEAELRSSTTALQVGGLGLTVVDLAGTGASPQGILGAMVPFAGATWFFKLQGPLPLVAREKPAFLAFLETVQPAANSAP